eukprot:CAMPEP_0182881594 /NCGR_PEP_ID=MMETSP0034_2-20130328/17265_1 /TAXON_ID=156128 /ORGANISM="Nephroselmis pyriformis, Strain CCMP717" /LENGTH=268 /DNA_ID=CAMNT_0025014629 /DNA_START=6 /DNA_END=812 /DNA_ORIENTATION=-
MNATASAACLSRATCAPARARKTAPRGCIGLYANPPSPSRSAAHLGSSRALCALGGSRAVGKIQAETLVRDRTAARGLLVRCAAGGGAGAKKSVLFVCLGNICRSPTAEAMFTAVVEKKGLADQFDIDSCGTGGGNASWFMPGGWSYHEGDDADPRMTSTAAKRGVKLTSKSRPLKPEDFDRFDYVVGMDANNIRAITTAAQHWSQARALPAGYEDKVKLMCDFCRLPENAGVTEVPDPYYGGTAGFEKVLDLLEDACEGLLEDMYEG